MSAPDVNIDKQKKRHRTMVWGIWIGVAIAGLVMIGFGLASMFEDQTASHNVSAGDKMS